LATYDDQRISIAFRNEGTLNADYAPWQAAATSRR
jgi:hypothetical protein